LNFNLIVTDEGDGVSNPGEPGGGGGGGMLPPIGGGIL